MTARRSMRIPAAELLSQLADLTVRRPDVADIGAGVLAGLAISAA